MLPKVEDGIAPGSEGIHGVADGANHGRTPIEIEGAGSAPTDEGVV